MTNHSTEIMNQATQDFIRQHQDEDVGQLAFLGHCKWVKSGEEWVKS
jgi:hypothetical protein